MHVCGSAGYFIVQSYFSPVKTHGTPNILADYRFKPEVLALNSFSSPGRMCRACQTHT